GRLVHGPAEAYDVEQDGGLVVGRVVEDLHAADLVDALADAGDGEREHVVGEARVDAVDEDRRAALGGGLPHRVGHLGRDDAVGELQEHRAAGHDVDAGPQDAAQVVDRLHQPDVGHRGV